MDPKKTIAVQEWPIPKNVHELQQFLGLGNWLCCFVEGYSLIIKPLTSLTGKAEWNPPVLAIPNNDDPFRVEADASDFATGGVLLQKQEGKWKVIAYRSSTLLDAEQNYEIYDKEMLAIVQALKEWRQYLQGANQPFEVWTDHANLTYFKAPQKLNRRQARWRLDLAEFDFTLVHKPGKTLGKADLLSRRADYNKGEHDNETSRSSRTNGAGEHGGWGKTVRTGAQGWRVVERSNSQGIDDKLKEVLERLRTNIGANKTVSMVSRSFWWPNMYVDVRNYVRGCDRCQRTKALRVTRARVLHPNEVPEAPWQIVTVNLIGELPESNGFNAICVVVDRFSKQIHAIPTMTKLTAEGMAHIYRDQVFRLHGLPKKIIHDRGIQFDAKMMKELYKLLHIEGNPSTAYHPQTDGQTERVNQELEQYLRLYVNHRQLDWADWLALAEFAYNNREHSATKLSPFFVNSGVHPVGFTGIRTSSSNMSAEEFAKHVKGIHELVQANLVKANEDMKHFYDRHTGKSMEYEAGSKVFLDGRNIKTTRPTKKMDDKWFGPFEIVEKSLRAIRKFTTSEGYSGWSGRPTLKGG
ncbi:hypothetical protein ACEPAH_9517 [Sanghuangporus vaninii]